MEKPPQLALFSSQRSLFPREDIVDAVATRSQVLICSKTGKVQVMNSVGPVFVYSHSLRLATARVKSITFLQALDCLISIEEDAEGVVDAYLYFGWQESTGQTRVHTDVRGGFYCVALSSVTGKHTEKFVCLAACNLLPRVAVSTGTMVTLLHLTRTDDGGVCVERVLDMDVTPLVVTYLCLRASWIAVGSANEVKVVTLHVHRDHDTGGAGGSGGGVDGEVVAAPAAEWTPFRGNYDVETDAFHTSFEFDTATGALFSAHDRAQVLPVKGLPRLRTHASTFEALSKQQANTTHFVVVNRAGGFRVTGSQQVLYRRFSEKERVKSITFQYEHGLDTVTDRRTQRLVCVIATNTSGYVYDIVGAKLLCQYAFMHSCVCATINYYFLYALTIEGLEVWTLRTNTSHQTQAATAPAPWLIGFYPLNGLHKLVFCGEFLVMLRESDVRWHSFEVRNALLNTADDYAGAQGREMLGEDDEDEEDDATPASGEAEEAAEAEARGSGGEGSDGAVGNEPLILEGLANAPRSDSDKGDGYVVCFIGVDSAHMNCGGGGDEAAAADAAPRGDALQSTTSAHILHFHSVLDIYEDIIQNAKRFRKRTPSVFFQMALEGHELLTTKIYHLMEELRVTAGDPVTHALKSTEEIIYRRVYRHSSSVLGAFHVELKKVITAAEFFSFSDSPLDTTFALLRDNATAFITYADRVLFDPEMAEYTAVGEETANDILRFFAREFPLKLSTVIIESSLQSFDKRVALELLDGGTTTRTARPSMLSTSQERHPVSKDEFARCLLNLELGHVDEALDAMRRMQPQELVHSIVCSPSLVHREAPARGVPSFAQLLCQHAPWSLVEVLILSADSISITSGLEALQHAAPQLFNLQIFFLEAVVLLGRTDPCKDGAEVVNDLVRLYLDDITSPTPPRQALSSRYAPVTRFLWLDGLPPLVHKFPRWFADTLTAPMGGSGHSGAGRVLSPPVAAAAAQTRVGRAGSFNAMVTGAVPELGRLDASMDEVVMMQRRQQQAQRKRMVSPYGSPVGVHVGSLEEIVTTLRMRKEQIDARDHDEVCSPHHEYTSLCKLQALLCSKTPKDYAHILDCVRARAPFEGKLALEVLCLISLDRVAEAFDVLVAVHPRVAFFVAKQHCKGVEQWRWLLVRLLGHMKAHGAEGAREHRAVYADVLEHTCGLFDVDVYVRELLPADGNMAFFLPYITRAFQRLTSTAVKQTVIDAAREAQ